MSFNRVHRCRVMTLICSVLIACHLARICYGLSTAGDAEPRLLKTQVRALDVQCACNLTKAFRRLVLIDCSIPPEASITESQHFQFVDKWIIGDGYIVENSLQGSELDIRLEDFFWTGSGDGPPSYIRKPNTASEPDGSTGRETIIKTATVVATVYIDSSSDSDPLCMYDCNDSAIIAANYKPSDRRYWLLTILGGYFRSNDYPVIEHKLATLYRIAFSRQQSWHLGIGNNTLRTGSNGSYSSNDDIDDNNSSHIVPTKLSEYKHENSSPIVSIGSDSVSNADLHRMNKRNANVNESAISKSPPATSPTPASTPPLQRTDTYRIQPNVEINARKASSITTNGGRKISVLVHNVTTWSEDERRNGNNNDATPKNDVTTISNQTEIVYSVFVDGIAVLATTAADDMKLVTDDEVAHVMDKMVYTKAEPYLKEPQATPLIPATSSNQNSNLIAVIAQNPLMLAIGAVMLLMVVILLIGLLLMTRAKRSRSAEVKRLTARRALIEASPSSARSHGDDEMHSSGNVHEPTAGVENSAYDKESEHKEQQKPKKIGKPVLHFPHPPASSPTSSSTSDSSVYYPKRRSRLDIQNILDEKAVNLFTKKARNSVDTVQDDNAVYATIAKKKERKLKQKRKYLSENRVGSLDGGQNQSSQSSSSSDAFETSSKMPHYYEHVEAINPNVAQQYHKNKLLNDGRFTVHSPDEDLDSPTETYNKEILKALQRDTRSPGSGSIGSFLSMASVRSFPKCSVPEPLSRVLEPLSVVHLDASDEGVDSGATGRMPRIVEATYKRELDHSSMVHDDEQQLYRSQSDGADPGVIGPVVWEIHKKELEQRPTDVLSPVRDPVKTRNRFEGLLEGAIKMYSNDIQNEVFNEINSGDGGGVATKQKENRGKSAIPSRKPGILIRSSSEFINRPVTAGPLNGSQEYSTQPPSPYKKAWGSGAPSPMVRPLSAGPFHRPEVPLIDVTRVLAPVTNDRSTAALSTAPLIEAIQNELKKFDKENRQ